MFSKLSPQPVVYLLVGKKIIKYLRQYKNNINKL